MVEKTIGLAGGVLVTTKVPSGAKTWSFPNIHGDIVLTSDNAGGTKSYFVNDAFGQTIYGGSPENSSGNFDCGWLGSQHRGYEHAPGISVIEMGARQYSPALGRFVEVDPVEGGVENDYGYPADPVNDEDITGLAKSCLVRPSTSIGGRRGARTLTFTLKVRCRGTFMSQVKGSFRLTKDGQQLGKPRVGPSRGMRPEYSISRVVRCGASCDGNYRMEWQMDFRFGDADEYRAVSSANSYCTEPRSNHISCTGNYGVSIIGGSKYGEYGT